MKIASFAPLRNTEEKRDADEFRREAVKFSSFHGPDAKTYLFDNGKTKTDRAAYVREALAYYQDLDAVCFFSHGGRTSIQAGFSGVAGAESLAASLARFSSLRTVVLYCCSTASGPNDDVLAPGPGGDGGFADALRDELAQTFSRAVTVYGHQSIGHTTQNPYVRRFSHLTGAGGEWVIAPKSERWNAWCRALRSSPDVRFKFPWMTQDALEAELERFG